MELTDLGAEIRAYEWSLKSDKENANCEIAWISLCIRIKLFRTDIWPHKQLSCHWGYLPSISESLGPRLGFVSNSVSC